MAFGDKLKALREENAMDINSLAEELGVCRQSIYHWEHNKKKPNRKYIRQIAKIFKVDVKQLIN